MGQKLNRSKTCIFFSKSIPIVTQYQIKEFVAAQEIKHYEKYPRLPALVSKKKKVSLA